MSNNWIIVDRTSQSRLRQYLLELALAQVQQKPTVIVIDSEDRLAVQAEEPEGAEAAGARRAQGEIRPSWLGPSADEHDIGVAVLTARFHGSERIRPSTTASGP